MVLHFSFDRSEIPVRISMQYRFVSPISIRYNTDNVPVVVPVFSNMHHFAKAINAKMAKRGNHGIGADAFGDPGSSHAASPSHAAKKRCVCVRFALVTDHEGVCVSVCVNSRDCWVHSML